MCDKKKVIALLVILLPLAYADCQEIYLNSTGNFTDYPYYLEIPFAGNFSIYNTKCGGNPSELGFEIEYQDENRTIIWLEVDELSDKGKTISIKDNPKTKNFSWNYGIIYHMYDLNDSTINNRDVVSEISAPDLTTDFLGYGKRFENNAWSMADLTYWEQGWSTRTHEVFFETSTDIQSRQTIIAEGGTTNGAMLYIYKKKLYARWWSESQGWNGGEIKTNIENNTRYYATMTYEYPGRYRLFLNGEQKGNKKSQATMNSHTGNGGIAYTGDEKDFHDGSFSGAYFNGTIYEIRVADEIIDLEMHNQTWQMLNNEFIVIQNKSLPIQMISPETSNQSNYTLMINTTAKYCLANDSEMAKNGSIFSYGFTELSDGDYEIPVNCSDSFNNKNSTIIRFSITIPGCNNSIKDQDEEEVDCGGICNPCKKQTTTTSSGGGGSSKKKSSPKPAVKQEPTMISEPVYEQKFSQETVYVNKRPLDPEPERTAAPALQQSTTPYLLINLIPLLTEAFVGVVFWHKNRNY